MTSDREGPSGTEYELDFDEGFDGDVLDEGRWIPHYLPQWSTSERSAARYRTGGGRLRLVIEADQPPWCPEFDGAVRVSSLQTGVFAGGLGSRIGQHRFNPDLVVREEQQSRRLYTPPYGLIEVRAKALDDPTCMVALWMIGYEDAPENSAEICVFEIFGRDVQPDCVKVGMGVHPSGIAGSSRSSRLRQFESTPESSTSMRPSGRRNASGSRSTPSS